jgi:A/G-specific adenine glycosylase
MLISRRKIVTFQKNVLTWYATNKRDLPWRRTSDPYQILVSEVMLQQTQVDRVILKYEAFLARFPTLEALAKAELGEVLRLWQGLGYNRRAKKLWELARHQETSYLLYSKKIELERKDPLRLVTLPGIGHYTANAVAAFAWNNDVVAFDTNLRRVHERYFGKDEDAQALAQRTLPLGKAREWNNALMDFGSAVCTKAPKCGACPLRRNCVAYTNKDFAIAVPKQSTFKGSNRFYRGAILRALAQGAKTRKQLSSSGTDENIDAALSQLLKEKLVTKKNAQFTLP